MLPVVGPAWRTRDYAWTLLIAHCIAAAPLIAAWPLALHAALAGVVRAWLRRDLHSLFTGGAATCLLSAHPAVVRVAGVGGVLVDAVGSASRRRRNPYAAPADSAAADRVRGYAVAALSLGSGARELYALPLLPALALLAVPGISKSAARRRQCVVLVQRDGRDVFYCRRLVLLDGPGTGRSGATARASAPHCSRATAGLQGIAVSVAALLTPLAWFVLLTQLKRIPARPVIAWAAGVTVMWALLNCCSCRWVDTGKSYRSVFVSMKQAHAGAISLRVEPRSGRFATRDAALLRQYRYASRRKSPRAAATAICCWSRASRREDAAARRLAQDLGRRTARR